MMNVNGETASSWFTLNSGFKVYGRCPDCHSPNIAYYKIRLPGLKGISLSSKGPTPACLDCGKNFPEQNFQHNKKPQKGKMINSRF